MNSPSGLPVMTMEPIERSPRSDRTSRVSWRTISAFMKLCGGWSTRTTRTRPRRSVSKRSGIGREAYARALAVEADVDVIAVVGLGEPVRVRGTVRIEAVDQLRRLLPGGQGAELAGERPARPVG